MQQIAVNLLKTFWAPLNSWNIYTSHIVALDLLCCHRRRHSYLSGIGLLQLYRVIQSVNKADHCRPLLQWLGKKSDSRRKPSVKFWLLTPGIKKCFPTWELR